jgi:hypothetical protein
MTTFPKSLFIIRFSLHNANESRQKLCRRHIKICVMGAVFWGALCYTCSNLIRPTCIHTLNIMYPHTWGARPQPTPFSLSPWLNTSNHKVLTYLEYRAVSGVFRTIDPHHTRRAVRGWWANISKDARHWIGLLKYNPSTHKIQTNKIFPLILQIHSSDVPTIYCFYKMYSYEFWRKVLIQPVFTVCKKRSASACNKHGSEIRSEKIHG